MCVVMFTFVDQYTFDSILGGNYIGQSVKQVLAFFHPYLIYCLVFDLPLSFPPLLLYRPPFNNPKTY